MLVIPAIITLLMMLAKKQNMLVITTLPSHSQLTNDASQDLTAVVTSCSKVHAHHTHARMHTCTYTIDVHVAATSFMYFPLTCMGLQPV